MSDPHAKMKSRNKIERRKKMNKAQVKAIIAKHIPACPPAPEWVGVEVRSCMGVGVVSEAFHNVNDGITLKVIYPNGSGWTFADKVSVVAWHSNA